MLLAAPLALLASSVLVGASDPVLWTKRAAHSEFPPFSIRVGLPGLLRQKQPTPQQM